MKKNLYLYFDKSQVCNNSGIGIVESIYSSMDALVSYEAWNTQS